MKIFSKHLRKNISILILISYGWEFIFSSPLRAQGYLNDITEESIRCAHVFHSPSHDDPKETFVIPVLKSKNNKYSLKFDPSLFQKEHAFYLVDGQQSVGFVSTDQNKFFFQGFDNNDFHFNGEMNTLNVSIYANGKLKLSTGIEHASRVELQGNYIKLNKKIHSVDTLLLRSKTHIKLGNMAHVTASQIILDGVDYHNDGSLRATKDLYLRFSGNVENNANLHADNNIVLESGHLLNKKNLFSGKVFQFKVGNFKNEGDIQSEFDIQGLTKGIAVCRDATFQNFGSLRTKRNFSLQTTNYENVTGASTFVGGVRRIDTKQFSDSGISYVGQLSLINGDTVRFFNGHQFSGEKLVAKASQALEVFPRTRIESADFLSLHSRGSIDIRCDTTKKAEILINTQKKFPYKEYYVKRYAVKKNKSQYDITEEKEDGYKTAYHLFGAQFKFQQDPFYEALLKHYHNGLLIKAEGELHQKGNISSDGTSINCQAGAKFVCTGKVESGLFSFNHNSIKAQEAENHGALHSQGWMNIDIEKEFTNHGQILAKDLMLKALSFENTKNIQWMHQATIETQEQSKNSGNMSGAEISWQARNFENLGSIAVKDLVFKIQDKWKNSQNITSQNTITIQASNVEQQGDMASKNASVIVEKTANLQGTTNVEDSLYVQAQNVSHTGQTKAEHIKFDIKNNFNNAGSIGAEDTLTIIVDTLTNSNKLTGPTISIKTRELNNEASGAIQATTPPQTSKSSIGTGIHVQAATAHNQGTIEAEEAVLDIKNLDNSGQLNIAKNGRIQGESLSNCGTINSKNLSVESSQSFYNSGNLEISENLFIDAYYNTNFGYIAAKDALLKGTIVSNLWSLRASNSATVKSKFYLNAGFTSAPNVSVDAWAALNTGLMVGENISMRGVLVANAGGLFGRNVSMKGILVGNFGLALGQNVSMIGLGCVNTGLTAGLNYSMTGLEVDNYGLMVAKNVSQQTFTLGGLLYTGAQEIGIPEMLAQKGMDAIKQYKGQHFENSSENSSPYLGAAWSLCSGDYVGFTSAMTGVSYEDVQLADAVGDYFGYFGLPSQVQQSYTKFKNSEVGSNIVTHLDKAYSKIEPYISPSEEPSQLSKNITALNQYLNAPVGWKVKQAGWVYGQNISARGTNIEQSGITNAYSNIQYAAEKELKISGRNSADNVYAHGEKVTQAGMIDAQQNVKITAANDVTTTESSHTKGKTTSIIAKTVNHHGSVEGTENIVVLGTDKTFLGKKSVTTGPHSSIGKVAYKTLDQEGKESIETVRSKETQVQEGSQINGKRAEIAADNLYFAGATDTASLVLEAEKGELANPKAMRTELAQITFDHYNGGAQKVIDTANKMAHAQNVSIDARNEDFINTTLQTIEGEHRSFRFNRVDNAAPLNATGALTLHCVQDFKTTADIHAETSLSTISSQGNHQVLNGAVLSTTAGINHVEGEKGLVLQSVFKDGKTLKRAGYVGTRVERISGAGFENTAGQTITRDLESRIKGNQNEYALQCPNNTLSLNADGSRHILHGGEKATQTFARTEDLSRYTTDETIEGKLYTEAGIRKANKGGVTRVSGNVEALTLHHTYEAEKGSRKSGWFKQHKEEWTREDTDFYIPEVHSSEGKFDFVSSEDSQLEGILFDVTKASDVGGTNSASLTASVVRNHYKGSKRRWWGLWEKKYDGYKEVAQVVHINGKETINIISKKKPLMLQSPIIDITQGGSFDSPEGIVRLPLVLESEHNESKKGLVFTWPGNLSSQNIHPIVERTSNLAHNKDGATGVLSDVSGLVCSALNTTTRIAQTYNTRAHPAELVANELGAGSVSIGFQNEKTKRYITQEVPGCIRSGGHFVIQTKEEKTVDLSAMNMQIEALVLGTDHLKLGGIKETFHHTEDSQNASASLNLLHLTTITVSANKHSAETKGTTHSQVQVHVNNLQILKPETKIDVQNANLIINQSTGEKYDIHINDQQNTIHSKGHHGGVSLTLDMLTGTPIGGGFSAGYEDVHSYTTLQRSNVHLGAGDNLQEIMEYLKKDRTTGSSLNVNVMVPLVSEEAAFAMPVSVSGQIGEARFRVEPLIVNTEAVTRDIHTIQRASQLANENYHREETKNVIKDKVREECISREFREEDALLINERMILAYEQAHTSKDGNGVSQPRILNNEGPIFVNKASQLSGPQANTLKLELDEYQKQQLKRANSNLVGLERPEQNKNTIRSFLDGVENSLPANKLITQKQINVSKNDDENSRVSIFLEQIDEVGLGDNLDVLYTLREGSSIAIPAMPITTTLSNVPIAIEEPNTYLHATLKAMRELTEEHSTAYTIIREGPPLLAAGLAGPVGVTGYLATRLAGPIILEKAQHGIEYVTGGTFKGLYEKRISPCLTPIEEFVGITREDTLTAFEFVSFAKGFSHNFKNTFKPIKLYDVKNSNPTQKQTKKIAKSALQKAGRTRRQKQLRALMNDPKVSSADRGWLKQEYNQILRGKSKILKLPPRKVLAHLPGFEAAKGFDYTHSVIQECSLHDARHQIDKLGKKNKTPKILKDHYIVEDHSCVGCTDLNKE